MAYHALMIDKKNLPLQLHQRLRLHWGTLPEDFRQALGKDLRNSPCLPTRTDLNPLGNALYSVELGYGVYRLVPWKDKIVAGLYNGMIKVLERNSGTLLFSLAGHTQYLEDLVVSGDTLASSSWDGTIRIWDLAKKEEVATLADQPGPRRYLAAVGEVLVSGSGCIDKTLGRWVGTLKARNIRTGKVLHSFEGLDDYVTSLTVSGNVLAAGSQGGAMRSWNLATGEPLVSYTGHSGKISLLKAVGNMLLGCNEEYKGYSILGWDLRTGEKLFALEGHTGKITCLEADGTTLLSGSEDGTLRSWDLEKGKPLQVLQGHAGKVLGLALYGDTVLSCSEDSTVRSWDIRTGEQLAVFRGHSYWVTSLSVYGGFLLSGDSAGAVKR
jgi:WD40 repeat protein